MSNINTHIQTIYDSNRILPPRLKRGQKIAVIAPSNPVSGTLPKEQIDRGYEYLKQKGFDVVEGASMHRHGRATYDSVEERVTDIHHFLRMDEVGCIMAFWGGYNANQILDSLDYELIKKQPKIFVGYSDITALTTAITIKTGLVTFSGPGVISFAKPQPFEYTWQQFEKMCIEPSEQTLMLPSPTFADDAYFLREDNDHRIMQENKGTRVYNNARATGEIVAGNLQTLLVLSGTTYFPDLKDKILFIEEDESATPALIDRFLTQCRQLGIFNVIQGLVFGRFTNNGGFGEQDTFESLLDQYFSRVSYPVIYNADLGHTDPLFTIPNGGTATLDDDKIIFHRAVR